MQNSLSEWSSVEGHTVNDSRLNDHVVYSTSHNQRLKREQ